MRFKSTFVHDLTCVGVESVGDEPLKRPSCYFIGRNDQRFLSIFVFDYHLHAGIWERVLITYQTSFIEHNLWFINFDSLFMTHKGMSDQNIEKGLWCSRFFIQMKLALKKFSISFGSNRICHSLVKCSNLVRYVFGILFFLFRNPDRILRYRWGP